jgi:hypothetical protein
MQDRALYSIQEARRLLGGISRNTIDQLLRTRQLATSLLGAADSFRPRQLGS